MPRVTDAALRRAFILAAAVWPLLLLISTYLAATGPHGNLVYVITAGVYAAAGIVCHQRPERSFHLWGAQMPVCARCAGLYLGACAAALIAGGIGMPFSVATTTSRTRRMLLVAALPTAATLLYEWTIGETPA